jgi:hypothetical protein
MRWVGASSTYEGEARYIQGKPEGRNHLENPVIYGKIILKWIFKKWDEWHGLD